jgi:hypothetical protein
MYLLSIHAVALQAVKVFLPALDELFPAKMQANKRSNIY